MPCWRCFDAPARRVPPRGAAPRLPRCRSRPVRRWAGAATSTMRWASTTSACRRPGPSSSSTSTSTPGRGRPRREGSRRRHVTTLHDLYDDYGQSPWIDNIRRDWLNDGTLAGLVDEGVRGRDVQPVDLRQGLRHVVGLRRAVGRRTRLDAEELFESSRSADVRDACDVLGAVHEGSSRGVRGRAASLLRRLRLARGLAATGPRHRRHDRGGAAPRARGRPART